MSDPSSSSSDEEQLPCSYVGAAVLLLYHAKINYNKQPNHDSVITGELYVKELLESTLPVCMKDVLGMSGGCFRKLCHKLKIKTSKHIGKLEATAFGLYILRYSASSRNAGERFQHSTTTITVYFRRFIKSIIKIGLEYMIQKSKGNLPVNILLDPEFGPFFHGALGALDGVHVAAHCNTDKVKLCRN